MMMRESLYHCRRGVVTGTALWLAILTMIFGGVVSEVRGQGATATITGTVMDQSEAVVPGAQVMLIDEKSGDTRRTVSNPEGYFTFSAVQAKAYKLRVEYTGFQAWERIGIEVHPADKINISDIRLTAGAQTETVTVSAEAEQIIPVDSGEKSNLITSKQIQNLAIIGRDATELLKILPGLTPTNTGLRNAASFTGEVIGINGNGAGGKQSAIGNYSANGGTNAGIDIISDGTHVSDPGCNCASPVSPNVEMIQEFKVQGATFAAENAKGPVVISSVSKSGGSEFHGEGYFYGRRSWLNANDWLANRSRIPRPNSNYSFPGFNIGGPVVLPGGFNKNKDKLFFFFGAEWIRQGIDTGTKRAIVPTEAMLNGDFTDSAYLSSLARGGVQGVPNANGFVNGMITDRSLIDPGALALMRLYPKPNRDPRTNDGFNWVTNEVVNQNMNQQRIRIDYSISDNTKLYTSYNRQRELQPFNFGLWWNSSAVPTPSRVIAPNASDAISANLTHVFSPTMTNEFTFGYTFVDFPNKFEDPTKMSRKAIGYSHSGLFKSGLDQIPSMTDWGSGIADIFLPGGFDPVLFATKHLASFGDNVTKVYKTHTFKAGFYYEHVINKQPNSGNSNGVVIPANWASSHTGNNYANLLLGIVAQYDEQTKNLINDAAYNVYEGFVQDSWKVRPNFTLDLGVRLSRFGHWYGRNGAAYAIFDRSRYSNNPADLLKYTGIASHNTDSSIPLSGADNPGLAFGPRIGFAYSAFKDTVFRGGYGLFNWHDEQDSGPLVNPPTTLNSSVFNTTLAEIDSLSPSLSKSSANVRVRGDNRQPRTHSWNFTISQRLPNQMLLEASYVGSATQRLLGNYNINTVPEGATLGIPGADFNNFRPLVNYAAVTVREHLFSQNYNSLQMLLARQTGRLTYSVAYTFGKNLGYQRRQNQATGDLSAVRSRDYGVINFDRTHILNVAYSWLVPDLFKGNAIGKAIVNGWQFSGITIFQSGINLGANTGNFSITGTGPGGVSLGQATITGTDAITVQPLLLCDPRSNLASGQYLNGNCFGSPAPGRNGAFQFPYIRGPFFQNHDLSVFKNFQIGSNENHKLQLRFSGYNFLNHPLNSFVDGDPRLQLNYNNGVLSNAKDFGFTNTKLGRRIVQFAVKFMF
ncbi:MAG: carboxypeptidase regulatory-like domain-containing protein [Acidobacteriota bacterium]